MRHLHAPWLWARSTIRSQWRATMFLALFAGLAAGAVLTSIEVARRTSSAYDRYLQYAHIADVSLAACPIGVTKDSMDGFDVCFTDENVAEVHRLASSLPEAGGMARVALGPIGVADPSLPNGWQGTLALATIEGGPEFSIAKPIVVAGRLPAAGAADEVAVNEEILRSLSLHVGDTLTLGTILAADLPDQEQANFVPNGTRSNARIVGAVRLPDDLQPGQSTKGINGLTVRDPMVYLPQAWWTRHGVGAAVYNESMAIWASPGSNPGDLLRAIDERFGDRLHFTDSPITDPAPLTRVIDLQSAAAWAIAVIALLAAIAFVGQAIARTVRRDLAEGSTLRALGFDRRHTVVAATLRMTPAAGLCGVLAAATAVIASPIGPIGVARQAEVEPGIRWDVPVVVLGSLAGGLAVLVAAAVAAARVAVNNRSPNASARRIGAMWGPLGVTARAGAVLARTAGTRAAAASACVAVVAAVGAGAMLRDIATLESTPSRYGVTWDLSVGAYTSYASLHAGQQVAAGHSEVVATGSVRSTSVNVDGHELLIMAFDSQTDPAIGPVIVEGRAPLRDNEIALGGEAMHVLGVGIGDRFQPPSESSAGIGPTSPVGPLTVVGQVVVNDNDTDQRNGGAGGVITDGLFDQLDPLSVPQDVLVKLAPGTDLRAAVGRLRPEFGGIIGLARPQADVRNLERVTPQLRVVAPIIALFAIAALAHALIITVRGRRRDLATMRALGFTRRQISATIGWHALFVQLVALAVGLPLGAVAARWAWSSLQGRLGVVPAASTPWQAMLVAAAGSLLVCVAALVFGRRVGTTSTVRSLQAE